MALKPYLRVPPSQIREPRKGEGMERADDTSKVNNTGDPPLLSFQEMPEWFRQVSNKWILHGYRPISGSAHASLGSWSYVHNESVNIFSHLIPAMLFLLGEWYLQQSLSSKYSEFTGADLIAFSIFMLAAFICFSLSATYHTLINHSKHVEHLCLRLDMLGVVLFILGDLALGIYVVFWCESLARNIYWSMVSCPLHPHSASFTCPKRDTRPRTYALLNQQIGVVGTMTVFMVMHPKFQGPKYRTFRALTFVATGLSGLAPLVHGLNVFGMSGMMRKAFPYTLAKAGCLLSGTTFYTVSPPISYKRRRTLTCMVYRPGSPNVAFLASLTYAALIRPFTSLW